MPLEVLNRALVLFGRGSVCTDARRSGDDREREAGLREGITQTCVGPGGCQGGQACLSDGSGFSSCDCGQVIAKP